MKALIHAGAGALALLTIGMFWSATVISELFGGAVAVAQVKTGILAGMAVLIPAMAVAGASGLLLGRSWKSPLVRRKLARMKVVALNGIVVLLPSAVFLALRARAGLFDGAFVAVQALELGAGAVNIALLSLNLRDGLKLRRPARLPA